MNSETSDQPHQSNEKFLDEIVSKLSELKNKIPPEKEYLISALAAYVYLALLIAPETLPQEIQPILELLDEIPMRAVSLRVGLAASFIGTVDGARRMVFEYLPLFKAYLQVFLMDKEQPDS